MKCVKCDAPISNARSSLGYDLCLVCGEREARRYRHTIVPMHKSNYVPVTDREILKQLTRPGRGLGG